MPAHSQIETYTKRFSENVEAGWETLRALHELGYELVAHQEQELMFIRANTAIVPIAMSGRLAWMHSMSTPVHRVNLNMRLMRGEPHFTDAMAVAAWWEIEVANNPQPEPYSAPGPAAPTWQGPTLNPQHVAAGVPYGGLAPIANPPWDGNVSPKQQAEMEAFLYGINSGRGTRS
jgi:hypothetical protein